jgi:HK97 family phage prohead protease
MNDLMTLKQFAPDLEVQDGERAVIARITTASVDRDGDVVLPSGADTRDFLENPVVLFGHDSSRVPVGKAVSMKRTPNDIKAKVEFAKRPDTHPDAVEWVPDTVLALFQQKVLRAFSIGFTIDDARDAGEKDLERFGKGARRIITRWKLLEFSVVPIPANQEALATAVSKGIVTAGMWTYDELDEAAKGPPLLIRSSVRGPEPLRVRA